jgi:hypothetical protein
MPSTGEEIGRGVGTAVGAFVGAEAGPAGAAVGAQAFGDVGAMAGDQIQQNMMPPPPDLSNGPSSTLGPAPDSAGGIASGPDQNYSPPPASVPTTPPANYTPLDPSGGVPSGPAQNYTSPPHDGVTSGPGQNMTPAHPSEGVPSGPNQNFTPPASPSHDGVQSTQSDHQGYPTPPYDPSSSASPDPHHEPVDQSSSGVGVDHGASSSDGSGHI